jgi:CRP/FNR family transcriptional regulator
MSLSSTGNIAAVESSSALSLRSPTHIGVRTQRALKPATPAALRCSTCSLRTLCMPAGLTHEDFDKIDSMICSTQMVKRGEVLYGVDAPFKNIYAIRTGSFKTVVTHPTGREQVTGFQIAGELLGLDGIYAGAHTGTTIALEDSSVCVIPFHVLEVLCREISAIQHHVHKLMSGEIVRESTLVMMLGNMRAEERVAAFLLNLSKRLSARGYSSTEFHLRMTRDEMGSYLGMKLETVSRMFSKFQREGLISVQGKQIRFLDLEGLRAV